MRAPLAKPGSFFECDGIRFTAEDATANWPTRPRGPHRIKWVADARACSFWREQNANGDVTTYSYTTYRIVFPSRDRAALWCIKHKAAEVKRARALVAAYDAAIAAQFTG